MCSKSSLGPAGRLTEAELAEGEKYEISPRVLMGLWNLVCDRATHSSSSACSGEAGSWDPRERWLEPLVIHREGL